MDKIIGLGDLVVSNDHSDVLKTYALSSCVGITVYSKSKMVAGMAHIVLPSHFNNINKNAKPAYYATTGVPLLIKQMVIEYGCSPKDLTIKLFGGAKSKNSKDIFKVGIKNLTTIQSILKSMNLHYQLVDTGGTFSRSIEMDVFTGNIKITKMALTV